MTQCIYVNDKTGKKCNKRKTKDSEYCSTHKHLIKKNSIYNEYNQELSNYSQDDMEESPNSNNINRYFVFDCIAQYNQLYNKPNEPVVKSSAMDSAMLLIIPLMMKLIPLLIKYFNPNNITNNDTTETTPPIPRPSADNEICRTGATDLHELQGRNDESDIIPIIQETTPKK